MLRNLSAELEVPASELATAPPAAELPGVELLVAEAAGKRSATPPQAWHGEGWLLAQAQGAFTIQLVSVSTMERAAAFLAKQSRPEDFAIYQLNRDGPRVARDCFWHLWLARRGSERRSATTGFRRRCAALDSRIGTGAGCDKSGSVGIGSRQCAYGQQRRSHEEAIDFTRPLRGLR